ncbi:hypothetical protein DUNSADRAFT_10451 [Dunaliella salina]|uniref:Uncharacterized protein n=1 Tax=Dunaliella salina TaxID=3046 RepID=A0ABZ3KVT8_DUNSA|nr:hypothetical protein DUNSADRAFT_10451 [Dunaliella salina]|eukprot:KAF5833286.1 hypothetical protein DUNSADRAFT_10451 [Dunaliella salina]
MGLKKGEDVCISSASPRPSILTADGLAWLLFDNDWTLEGPCPVLAPPIEGQHGDLVAFLEHCWGSLTPSELACAVYPHLSAYADPDTVVCSNLPLSKSMLHPPPTSGVSQIPPIFLLDAYIIILVRVVREGSEDAQLFFHLLLDEPAEESAGPAGQGEGAAPQNGGDSGKSSSSREQHTNTMGSSADARGAGFQHFLEHVRLEVVRLLQ